MVEKSRDSSPKKRRRGPLAEGSYAHNNHDVSNFTLTGNVRSEMMRFDTRRLCICANSARTSGCDWLGNDLARSGRVARLKTKQNSLKQLKTNTFVPNPFRAEQQLTTTKGDARARSLQNVQKNVSLCSSWVEMMILFLFFLPSMQQGGLATLLISSWPENNWTRKTNTTRQFRLLISSLDKDFSAVYTYSWLMTIPHTNCGVQPKSPSSFFFPFSFCFLQEIYWKQQAVLMGRVSGIQSRSQQVGCTLLLSHFLKKFFFLATWFIENVHNI